MKICKRCENNFEPNTHNQIVCIQCRSKHMKEIHDKHNRKKTVYKSEDWEKRIKRAMEIRAEYIADYYLETGHLLSF